jgi:hypothetical protein
MAVDKASTTGSKRDSAVPVNTDRLRRYVAFRLSASQQAASTWPLALTSPSTAGREEARTLPSMWVATDLPQTLDSERRVRCDQNEYPVCASLAMSLALVEMVWRSC